MKFGAMVATKVDDWKIFPECESLGYDHGWVPDSQMIWSDCYATLALAAAHTSRIKLGTGVAIAPTRLAPGRVFLGIGTGHTAMRGRISALNEPPEMTRASLAAIEAGAREVGRKLGDDFHTAAFTTAVVLRPGAPLASDRVIDAVGSQVAAALHYCWEGVQQSGNPNQCSPARPTS